MEKVYIQKADKTGEIIGVFHDSEPAYIKEGVMTGEWAEKLHGEYRKMKKHEKRQFTGHSSLERIR